MSALDKRCIKCYNYFKVNTVQLKGVKTINPEITSKEAIMQVCRRIAAEKGLKSLSMREVAGECGIAAGTLYNYYSNKDELLNAAIASVWEDIFRLTAQEETSAPILFSDYVESVFADVSGRFRGYPDFFTAHSASMSAGGKGRAKDAMKHCTEEIRGMLLSALRRDNSVDAKAFGGSLTEESFVEFVLDSIILLLIQQKSCDTLIAVIKKVIYRED